jgi:hypothetical protein
MALQRDDTRRSIGALLRDLAEGGASLVRDEARLARLEFGELARGVGGGLAFTAIGGVLAFLGGLSLLTGIILLVGDQWLRDHYWLAAIIVTILAGGVAYGLARRGLALLSPDRLAPDDTIATLKENKEWLKRPLTSGVTSR